MTTIGGDRELLRTDADQMAPAARAALAEFLVMFSRAILKTGHYESGHPEAKRSKAALFTLVGKVFEHQPQVTLSVIQFGENETVVVGGVVDDPIHLSYFLRQEGADLFLPKIREILLKNGVFSLTLSRGITDREFSHLIDLLTRSGISSRTADEGAAFVNALDTLGILHVQAIPLSGMRRIKRRLNWRVHVVFARLRRDLRRLPAALGMGADQVAALYRSSAEELLGQVRDPALVRDLFLNIDLIRDEVISAIGVDPVEVAARAIPADQVAPALAALFIAPVAQGQPAHTAAQSGAIRRAGAYLVERVAKADDHDAYPLLERLFKAGAVEFERLPPRLKLRIVSEQHADGFLAGTDAYLAAVRANAGAREYRGNLMEPFVVTDCLIRRGLLVEALSILTALTEVRDGHPGDDGRFVKVFETGLGLIRNAENLEQLKRLLQSEKKETRLAAIEVTGWFGADAAPFIIDLLRSAEDKWVRKSVLKSLALLGRDALAPALRILADPDESWFMKRNLLAFVGDKGGAAHAGPVAALAAHPHPRVREAALEALFALDPARAEPILLQALHDEDEAVTRKVVSILMRHGSAASGFLAFLKDALRADRTGGHRPGDGLLTLVVQAAGGLIGRREAGDEVEQQLVGTLTTESGFLGKLVLRMKAQVDDPVRIAIIEVLGRSGTMRSLKAVEHLAGDPSPAVAGTAAKALADLKKRLRVK